MKKSEESAPRSKPRTSPESRSKKKNKVDSEKNPDTEGRINEITQKVGRDTDQALSERHDLGSEYDNSGFSLQQHRDVVRRLSALSDSQKAEVRRMIGRGEPRETFSSYLFRLAREGKL